MKSSIENHEWDGDGLIDTSTNIPWLVGRIDARVVAPGLVQWEAYWREDGRWRKTEGTATSRAEARAAVESELKNVRLGVVRWRGRKAYIGTAQIGEMQENYKGYWVTVGTDAELTEEMARKIVEYAGGLVREARDMAIRP